jgi:hypothetical protein
VRTIRTATPNRYLRGIARINIDTTLPKILRQNLPIKKKVTRSGHRAARAERADRDSRKFGLADYHGAF